MNTVQNFWWWDVIILDSEKKMGLVDESEAQYFGMGLSWLNMPCVQSLSSITSRCSGKWARAPPPNGRRSQTRGSGGNRAYADVSYSKNLNIRCWMLQAYKGSYIFVYGEFSLFKFLKEKVTPETAYFLYSPINRPHWVEMLTVVSASIVHPIPVKFLSKEAKIHHQAPPFVDSA